MEPVDLERDIDTALRALPSPSAPPALVARVMRGVCIAEDPQDTRGWLQPWFAWRSGTRAGVALTLLAAAATLAWFNGAIVARLQSLASLPQVETARLVWQTVEPAIAGGAVYVLVMGVVAACVAAALTQVALEGTSS